MTLEQLNGIGHLPEIWDHHQRHGWPSTTARASLSDTHS